MAKRIKNNIETVLKENNKYKSWLAKKANVRNNTITDLIQGAEPRIRTAYKIARILDKSVYDIWPDIDDEKS